MINLVSLKSNDNPENLSVKKISPSLQSSRPLSKQEQKRQIFVESDLDLSNKEEISITPITQQLLEIELSFRGAANKDKLTIQQLQVTPQKHSKNKKRFLTVCSSSTQSKVQQTSYKRQQINNNLYNFGRHSQKQNRVKSQELSSQFSVSRIELQEPSDKVFNKSRVLRASLDYFEANQEPPKSGLSSISSSYQNKASFNLVVQEDEVGETLKNNQIPEHIDCTKHIQNLNHSQENVVNEKYKKKIKLVKKYQSKIPIEEQFRYCLGCLASVLHGNIGYHSRICSNYIQLMAKPLDQLLIYIEKTIAALQDNVTKILQQIKAQDLQLLKEHSKKMIQISNRNLREDLMSQDYIFEFQNVKKISKNWSILFEQLHKVNWFLRMRQNMKRQNKK